MVAATLARLPARLDRSTWIDVGIAAVGVGDVSGFHPASLWLLGALLTAGALLQRRSRVLLLTTFDHDDHLFRALRAGTSGFLLKSAPAEELVRGIRTVAAGDASPST